MKRIPMVATVNADTAHRTVTVVVEHADWQSFSRAVLPRATKEFKAWVRDHIMFGDLRRHDASLAWNTTRDGRCISWVKFTY